MRVAVIGAGAAGLAAAKYLTTQGDKFTCTVFEQTGVSGGTWVYTDQVGSDEFGLPIHSSLYKSLTTNLPKEVMSYPDFPIIAEEEYIPAEEMLQFLHKYKRHFDVEKYIKYFHHVKLVKPLCDGGWSIKVVDLKTQQENVYEFDAVIVCNGHYSTPHIPSYPGAEMFQGEQVHSHDYRTPERFQGKTVLVIGAGYSARDISLEVSSVAKQVILSHHLNAPITNIDFPASTIQKPDVKTFAKTSVTYADGSSSENVDVILYCTGYLFDFEFLDESCKISVDNNFVQPLYKHMINIELPTMCIVGIPLYVSPLSIFDLQIQYFLRTLTGEHRLPSRDAMIADTEAEMQKRRSADDFNNRKAHKMGALQEAYCNDLSDSIGIPRIKEVVFKRFNKSLCASNLLFNL